MDDNVLIPVVQALIPFHGSEILTARLADGRFATSIGSLCEMVKLAKHGQMERIRRSKDLKEHLLFILVKTPTGPQRIEALAGEAIRSWAMGIQVDRIAPEKRPLVRVLQEEAYGALSRALLKVESNQPAQPTPEPQIEPPPQSIRQESHTVSDPLLDRLFDVLYDMRQEERARYEKLEQVQSAQSGLLVIVEEWLASLDRRVAATGQGSAAELGWMPTLSGAHLADLRILFRSLEQATGRTQAQLEQELLETFRAPTINAILDELWQDVLDWWTWRMRQPG